MSKNARRYATVKEAAEYASTSTNTVRRWIQARRISGFGYGTRFLRVDLNEVDAMLSGQRVKVVA
ncbi:helix-turn-helix domain-containing protein [Corynebacterium variabile]|uniref:helix-turn-helix domain-containing protein n=1 Tax=Corynebacterium variabile TaxID=1727 RepID=UPI003FCFD24F